jgi:putative transposase
MRFCIVNAMDLLFRKGELSISDTSIHDNEAEIAALASELYQNFKLSDENENQKGGAKPEKKTQGVKEVVGLSMPSPRTARRWYASFRKDGMHGLADAYSKSGNRSSYFSPEEVELLNSTIRESYLSENRPTKNTTYEDVKLAFADENQARKARNLRLLSVPSREAVRVRINRLDAMEVVLCREGRGAAAKQFSPVTTGLDIDRPFQRIEMDECKIDLITIFKETGLFRLFTDDELLELGVDNSKGRWCPCIGPATLL